MKFLSKTLFGLGSLNLITSAMAVELHIPETFTAAKRAMYTKVRPNHGETFFIKCKWKKHKIIPNEYIDACDAHIYPKKYRKRAARTEAEHVIPVSWMYKKKWEMAQMRA